jgi:hypothetical protein
MAKKFLIFSMVFLGILGFLISSQSGFNEIGENINFVFAGITPGDTGGGVNPPTVVTNEVDVAKITACSAILSGEITNTGGQNADLRGFEWGTTSNPTGPCPGSYPNSWAEGTSGNYQYGTGPFNQKLWGFTPGVTYYYRAKAHNSGGWGCGSEKSFKVKQPNLYGWAWSERIGWISFNYKNCDTDNNGYIDSGICGGDNTTTPVKPYGVYLPPYDDNGYKPGESYYHGDFSCYAWSDKIGWIRFDPPDTADATTTCTKSPSYLSNWEAFGLIRACAGAANSDCTGGANPAAGGWDGWTCLLSTSPPFYEVNYGQISGKPNEFGGWAWGGGGTSNQNAVVGWISWNCADGGYNEETGAHYNVCSASDYKVYYQPENQNPYPPSLSDPTFDKCCYGCSNQAAQGLTITFNWNYSDPDGDWQDGFEIWIDNDSDFGDALSVGKFNYICSSGCQTYSFYSYLLKLADDIGCDWPNGSCNNKLTFGQKYYWKVKVKDIKGGWSDWSTTGDFTMPPNPSPYVDFKWCPLYPARFENTQFCSVVETGVCDATTCDLPTGEKTECYDANLNVIDCANWSWVFTDATSPLDPTPPAEISGSTPEYQNPRQIQFQSSGAKNVTLTVTDSSGLSCSKTRTVVVGLPLPEWKEIPPF